MKRSAVMAMVSFGAMLMFSGCVQDYQVFGETLVKENKVIGIKRAVIRKVDYDKSEGSKHQSVRNIAMRCNLTSKLIVSAKKALEHGYPYFTITYTKGSNKKPLPINTTTKMMHYCDSGYYDKESDLLDDKCGHIGLGKSTAVFAPGIVVYFHKKRNPFVPVWDAKAILEKEKEPYIKECMRGNHAMYERAMKDYDKIQSVEVD